MTESAATTLKPRKSPQQARSKATVEAILTATIQVLLADGAARLTTTRVAERAGVSVGTMYQYFPHKQALLLSLLQQHIARLLEAMETASARLVGNKLDEVGEGLAAAWLEVKLSDLETSRALYLVAAEFDIVAILQEGSKRMERAIEEAISGAPDYRPNDSAAAAFMLAAMLGGSVRAVLESGSSTQGLATLRRELPLACKAYLMSVAAPR